MFRRGATAWGSATSAAGKSPWRLALGDPAPRRRAGAAVLLALVAVSGVQCVQDLIVAPPRTTYAFSLTPDSVVVNVGDTVAPFHGQLTADGREVGFTLGLTVVEGANVVRVDSLGRLIVTGRGVARLRVRPLSVALPVDTIADTVTVWAAVPRIGLSTVRTEDTLTSLQDTFGLQATAQTRSGVTIPAAPIWWRQVSGAGTVTLLDSATGRVRAEANGSAEFEAAVDTVHARRTVRVVQRPTTLINTADTVRLRAVGQTWAIGAALRDARAHAVVSLSPAWQSKNTGIATVSSGQIRAVGEGTTQVIASYSGPGVNLADTTTVVVRQARLSLLSGNAQTGAVGTALGAPFVVQLVDGAAAAIRDSGVAVVFGVTSGGGHFGVATDTLRTADTVRTDLQGQARTTATLGKLVGANAFSASGSGLAGTALTFAATGTPAPVRTIAADSGLAQSDTVGRTLAKAFVVIARDTFGNAVSGVPVRFVVTGGGGKIAGQDSLVTTTDAQGRARATLTLGTTVGAHAVEARAAVPVGAPVAFAATGVPAAPKRLAFTVQPGTIVAGGSFVPAVQVTVRDTFGNRASGATNSVTLSIAAATGTAGAALGGTKTVAAVDAVASFSVVTVDKSGTGFRLVATAGGLGPDTSAAFNVSAGSADHMVFLAPPRGARAGAAVYPPVQVAVVDASGNALTSFTGDVTLSVGRVPATGSDRYFGTPVVAAVSGVATFSDFGIQTAAPGYKLRAATPGVVAILSDLFDVSGPPDTLRVVSGNAQGGIVNAVLSDSLVVRVVDAGGIGVPGDTVVFRSTAGGGTFGGVDSAVVLTVGGRAAVALRLGASTGTDTVVVRSRSLAGRTVTFTATAVEAGNRLEFVTEPATIALGTVFAPAVQVRVRDGFGRTVTGATAVVTLAVASGTGRAGATLTGTTSVAAAGGVATFTGLGVSRSGSGFRILATATDIASATSAVFDVRQVPAALAKDGGDNQNGTVGTNLGDNFVTRVLDAAGDPIAGDTVVYKVTSGVGTLSAGADSVVAVTDALGRALAGLALGPSPGTVTVSARSRRLAGQSVTYTASATAAGRALEFITQPTTLVAGATFSPAVQVRVFDPGTGATDPTAVTLIAITQAYGLTLTGAKVVAAVNGVATFGDLGVAAPVGAGYRLQAGAQGLLSTATSASFGVVAGAPVRLAIRLNSAHFLAGEQWGGWVSILDANGNVVAGATNTVTLALTGGTGTSGAHLRGTLALSAVAGVATFGGLSIDSAGTGYTLTATSSGLASDVTSPLDVSPAAAVRLVFATQPSGVVAGAPFSPAVNVLMKDEIGNVVTSANAVITLALGANPGIGRLLGNISVAVVGGTASFTDLRLRFAGTGYTLVASTQALPSTTSAAFDVAPAPASRLVFAVQPSNVAPDAAISPSVQVAVWDSIGNVVTSSSASIAVQITAGTGAAGAALSGTTTVNAVSGVASFYPLSIATAGYNYTLTATASGLAAAVSGQFGVVTNASNRLVFKQVPSQLTAGAPDVMTVAVEDGLGVRATGFISNVTLAITGGTGAYGAHLRGTSTVAAVAGLASFSGISVDSAGSSYTFTATATGVASGTSAQLAVTPAPAIRLELRVEPTSRTAGNVFSPAVQVVLRDSLGNLSAGPPPGPTLVTLSITSGTGAAGAVLVGTTTVPTGSSGAVFADLSIAQAGTGYSLTASVPGLPSIVGSAFSIVAGSVSRIVVTPDGASLSGRGATRQFAAQAFDRFDNPVSAAISWYSWGYDVAAIDAATGVVTARNAGQAAIGAGAGNVGGKAVVTVSIPEASPVNLWVRMPSGTSSDLFAVGGASSTDVYAAGNGGTVLRLESFAGWTSVASGTTNALAGVYAMAPGIFTVSGSGGTLRATDDAGASWTGLATGSLDPLAAVWGASSWDLFVVGQGGTVLRHRDRFVGAEQMTSGVTGWLWGVYGTSVTNVVAVGANGTVVRFDGTSWAPMAFPGTPNLFAVWGTSAASMYAAGEGVYHWNGSAWSSMAGSPAASGIWGASDNDIYTVTGNGDVHRYDGTTWTAMRSGTTANLHAVWGTSYGAVYAVGDGGIILRGERSARVVVTPESATLAALGATVRLTAEARAQGNLLVDGATFTWTSGDPAVATVDSTGVVTAVGNGSTIITATTPGGASTQMAVAVRQAVASISMPTGYGGMVGGEWTPPAEARDANGRAIAGQTYTWASLNPAVATVDASTGLVTFVGIGQAVIVAQAGSATGYTSVQPSRPADPVNLWAPMANPAGGDLTDVWGLSRTSIYAVGGVGLILHYNGVAWSQMASPATGNPQSLGGFADSLVWVGANNYPMLRFDGHTWSSEPDPGFVVEAIGGYNPRDFYMVGNSGTVRHYDGSSWSPVTSGTLQALQDVYQVTGSPYVVGAAGTILHGWVPEAVGLTNANLEGIWGEPNRLYAVGTGGTILRTRDETPWFVMTSGTTADLSSVTGTLADRDVYAVGGGGTILRFDGAAWAPMASGTTANLSAAWTAPDGDVYVVGTSGTILRGVRGATVAVTPPTPTLTALGATQQLTAEVRDAATAVVGGVRFTWTSANPAVATVDTNGVVTAVANGTAQITATAPGGASGSTLVTVGQIAKTLVVSPAGASLSGAGASRTFTVTGQDSLGHPVANPSVTWSSLNPNVATVDPDGIATAVGLGQGTIRATASGVASDALLTVSVPGATPVNLWAPMTSGTTNQLVGVWGSSASAVYAVGDGGTILRYNGTNWTQQQSNTTALLLGVRGVNQDVYAFGYAGTLLHLEGTWVPKTTGTNRAISGLWGASGMDLYAVSAGTGGAVHRYDGINWSIVTSGPDWNAEDVWGTSRSDVFVVGLPGRIMHYDGTGWSVMTSGTTSDVYALWGTSASSIYAVGYAGLILRYDGTSWHPMTGGTANNNYAVWGTSNSDIYAVGSQGSIQRYDGTTWHPMNSGTSQALNDVWGGAGNSDVYAVGVGGTILRGIRGATVTLTPSNPALYALGIAVQLGATVRDGGGNTVSGVTVTWTSSDTTVVKVSATGQVTGVAGGSATVTASAGAIVSSTTVTVAPSAQRLTRLTSGFAHACGLTSGGAAYCWGWNQHGQLGDGTTIDRASPVPVAGGLTFSTIAAFGAGNGWSTCGLTVGGTAYCWGSNSSGQLGDGTSTDRSSPVPVSGGLSFQAISAGPWHACGLTASGAAYCWGDNPYGELGDGTHTNRRTPVAVGGGLTFQRISAGYWHTCGVTATGAGYCWGDDSYGELGDGTNTTSSAPVVVAGGFTFQALDAGQAYSCGIVASGAAYCWGGDNTGQLGSGNAATNSPVAVPGGLTYQSISTGYEHACGLTAGGTAYCWGDNSYGELGDGTRGGGFNAPVAVTGGMTFQSISGGYFFTCAGTTSGATYCWGLNTSGQLGLGEALSSTVVMPAAVSTGQVFHSVTTGTGHTCGLTSGGAAYCWGSNGSGQLGDGTTTQRTTPVAVSTGQVFQSLTAYGDRTCGLTSGGVAYCWGGGLTAPVAVATAQLFQSIALGAGHTCGLTSGGAAYCWGRNAEGQLGDGTTTQRDTLVAVSTALAFKSLTAGDWHTCGVTTNSAAYCWGGTPGGQLTWGQLGDGTTTMRTTPVAVSTAQVFQTLFAGGNHTCGLTGVGAAYCWGDNSGGGDLGDGTGIQRNTPVAVGTAQLFQSLTMNGYHTCGVTTGGAAYCWGENGLGVLGDGTTAARSTPVAVSSAQVFQSVAAAAYHTCGVTTGGTAYCWGSNEYGQLGLGYSGTFVSPVAVTGGITFLTPLALR